MRDSREKTGLLRRLINKLCHEEDGHCRTRGGANRPCVGEVCVVNNELNAVRQSFLYRQPDVMKEGTREKDEGNKGQMKTDRGGSSC